MERSKIFEAFEEYETYMKSLQKTLSQSDAAHKPIADGKWSIAQMVMHLAEWDCLIREDRLPHMTKGADLEPLPDADEFNRQAIAKAQDNDFETIVAKALSERSALKYELQRLPDERWEESFYIAGKPTTVKEYFTEIVAHDAQHFEQINSFLT